jgi:hypothetical protein
MNIKLPFLLLIVAVFILAACSSNQNVADTMMDDSEAMSNTDNMTKEDDMMDDASANDSMGDEAHDDDMMAEEKASSDDMTSDMPMVETPAWFDYVFTDAVTGQTFRINDFQGKVILVETMAMWCSKCFSQQTQVNELHKLLGERDDFVGIGLDIDPNENITTLAGYVQKNGFDWLYSVPPVEISREIGNLYGTQFLNPPSTPILIVDRHGEAHPLPFGVKSAQDLLGYLEPFLNDNM